MCIWSLLCSKIALLEDFVTSGTTIRLLELWTSIFEACCAPTYSEVVIQYISSLTLIMTWTVLKDIFQNPNGRLPYLPAYLGSLLSVLMNENKNPNFQQFFDWTLTSIFSKFKFGSYCHRHQSKTPKLQILKCFSPLGLPFRICQVFWIWKSSKFSKSFEYAQSPQGNFTPKWAALIW